MLKRIVRMEFEPERVQEFLDLFEEVQDKIRSQEGCTHLELCRDAGLDYVYYTFSIWEDESYLNNYRHSDLFIETWAKTKALFGGKPNAFSLI